MKRWISLVLTLVLVLGLFVLPTVPKASASTPSWDNDGDGVLSILAIGNSFSDDAMEYVYNVAQSLGIKQIYLGRLYIGSCTLEMHRENAEGNKGAYTYYYNTEGTWVKVSGKSMLYALNRHSWDFITLQQQSGRSGLPETYNSDLDYVVNYVTTHKNATKAKLAWHMTWAYQQDTTKADFANYNKNQMTMYNAIVSTVKSKIVTNAAFSYVIPSGTAVQNARTSLIGDNMTRDGYHMSKPYGRYLTALTYVRTLTGLDISNIPYATEGVSEAYKRIAIESVNNATAKPFEVTQSKITNLKETIPDGYIQLKTPMYKGAFWHPQKSGRYNELIDDQSNSSRFFTTIRFTKAELPVGSIILIGDSAYKYRPDGWKTDALQSGTRVSETSERLVTVTDSWWGSWTIRSFNVSRKDDASVMGLTEAQMRDIFQIYVPQNAHSHKIEGGVCTLCGHSVGTSTTTSTSTTKKTSTTTKSSSTTSTTKTTSRTQASGTTKSTSATSGTNTTVTTTNGTVTGSTTQAGGTTALATSGNTMETWPGETVSTDFDETTTTAELGETAPDQTHTSSTPTTAVSMSTTSAEESDADDAGSLPWWPIIPGAVVIAGGVTASIVILRRKK